MSDKSPDNQADEALSAFVVQNYGKLSCSAVESAWMQLPLLIDRFPSAFKIAFMLLSGKGLLIRCWDNEVSISVSICGVSGVPSWSGISSVPSAGGLR